MSAIFHVLFSSFMPLLNSRLRWRVAPLDAARFAQVHDYCDTRFIPLETSCLTLAMLRQETSCKFTGTAISTYRASKDASLSSCTYNTVPLLRDILGSTSILFVDAFVLDFIFPMLTETFVRVMRRAPAKAQDFAREHVRERETDHVQHVHPAPKFTPKAPGLCPSRIQNGGRMHSTTQAYCVSALECIERHAPLLRRKGGDGTSWDTVRTRAFLEMMLYQEVEDGQVRPTAAKLAPYSGGDASKPSHH